MCEKEDWIGNNLLVVVDVTLRAGVGSLGRLKGNADKVLAEDVVEDAGPEATVLLKHLVDDVPGVDLALEVAHDLADVVLHHRRQGSLVVDLGYPGRQLRVPHGGVSADEEAVVLCELGSLVGGAELEVATAGLGGVPLHAVLLVSTCL